MRQPSSYMDLYAWHSAALAGHTPPIHDGEPQCGWYKTRFIKGGPWVAVEIKIAREIDCETGELASPERFIAEYDGMRADALRIWTYLTPISRADHAELIHRRATTLYAQATRAKINLETLITMRPNP